MRPEELLLHRPEQYVVPPGRTPGKPERGPEFEPLRHRPLRM